MLGLEKKGKGEVIMLFWCQPDHSGEIDCCTEVRERVFYHYLDFQVTNMNKNFFKFATFWWFCWNSTVCVSAPRVTFRDKQRIKRLEVCHCPCMRSMQSVWDIFFDLHVVTGLSRKSQASFFGNKKWYVHYLRTPFIKSVKFTRVQSLLLLRWVQTTPMNAITCAEMFSSIPNEQPAFSKIRSTETK